MLLIPAIDLKDGHCVRLIQGDMDQSTTFGEDPAAMATKWLEAGARRLHLVDLNGAFAGQPKKLRKSAKPWSELFSGWNWVAKILSRATADAKRPP